MRVALFGHGSSVPFLPPIRPLLLLLPARVMVSRVMPVSLRWHSFYVFPFSFSLSLVSLISSDLLYSSFEISS